MQEQGLLRRSDSIREIQGKAANNMLTRHDIEEHGTKTTASYHVNRVCGLGHSSSMRHHCIRLLELTTRKSLTFPEPEPDRDLSPYGGGAIT